MRQMDLGVAAQAGAVEPRAGGRMDDRRDDLAETDVGQAEDGRRGHADGAADHAEPQAVAALHAMAAARQDGSSLRALLQLLRLCLGAGGTALLPMPPVKESPPALNFTVVPPASSSG